MLDSPLAEEVPELSTQSNRIRAVRWGAAVAWAAVIFSMSSVPGSQVPGRFGTLAHFVEYAVFGILLYAALRVDRTRTSALWLSVAIASAYGVTDELHQAFVPMRVPDVMDWVVDTAGALFGALAGYRLDEWRERRSRQ